MAALCICILTGTALAGCGSGNIDAKVEIAVITKSTRSNFWRTVESGVNTAAVEYNAKVSFQGPENEEDYEAQNEMIEKAVKDKVDAIVLSAIDSCASVAAVEAAREQGIPIVIIDSGIESDVPGAVISTDNYAAGGMAAEPVLDLEGNIKVGIVNFDKVSANGQQREQGFRDALKEKENIAIFETVYVESNISSAMKGAKQLIEAHTDLNIIVTFNEWTTLGVGYAIEELKCKDQIQVIGFDNNVISIGMLETGEIDGLIVQNPFAEGYLGVETAYQLVKSKRKKGKDIVTDTAFITKENMYEKESQKILFPLDSKQ